MPEKGLGYWRNKLRREQSSELVPLVVRPRRTEGQAAVRIRLSDETVVELADPECVSARWVAELLRELAGGPR